tara:strand:+ start:311 stop:595 length:285 start_codon:yes stop_codon:yes gene_type:complete
VAKLACFKGRTARKLHPRHEKVLIVIMMGRNISDLADVGAVVMKKPNLKMGLIALNKPITIKIIEAMNVKDSVNVAGEEDVEADAAGAIAFRRT